MANLNNRHGLSLGAGLIALALTAAACGAFGGRYHIDPNSMDAYSKRTKIPLKVAVVLNPELCDYVYVSKRQGAKRVFEIGEALCTDIKYLSTAMFETATVVAGKAEGLAAHFDAVIIPRVIDTSVLVRPGAPPDFEATMIYECTMIDLNDRPVFVRTIKENKVLETYKRDSWKTVMQTTVDAVYSSLADEMVHSPEIRKYADSRKTENR